MSNAPKMYKSRYFSVVTGSIQLDPGESGSGSANSAGSGYESDIRHSSSDNSWEQKPHKYGILTRKVM